MSLWMSLVVAALGALGCGGGGAPVQSPVAVQAGRSMEQTEQAILEVLPRRSWTAESVQPGRVVAFLSVRKHLLRVDIRYDPRTVSIFYVDSDNLAAHVEANGQVYAHRKVNQWIQLLARDIGAALAVAPEASNAGGSAPTGPAPGPAAPAPLAAPAAPLTGAPPAAAPAQPLTGTPQPH
jgi:hypothetical protein